MANQAVVPQSISGAIKYIRSKAGTIAKARQKAELGAGRAKDALLIIGGSCAAGAAKSLVGDPALRGHIRMPKVNADLDLVVPALGVIGGIVDGFGQYSDDAVLFFAGATGVYLAEQVQLRVAAARSGVKVSGFDWGEDAAAFDPEITG